MAGEELSLTIKPKKETVANVMVFLLLCLAVEGYFFWHTWQTASNRKELFWTQIFIYAIFSLTIWALHRLGQINIAEDAVQIHRQGLQTTIFSAGQLAVERRDIKALVVVQHYGMKFLKIELVRVPEVMDRYVYGKGVITSLLVRLVGRDPIVPLSWLEIDEEYLRSFLKKYDEFMRLRIQQKLQARLKFENLVVPVGKSRKPKAADPLTTEEVRALDTEALPIDSAPVPSNVPEQALSLYESTIVTGQKPPNLRKAPTEQEKQVLLEKIKAIQKLVRESLLDRKTAEYYFDFFRYFPEWHAAGDKRVPSDLKGATQEAKDATEMIELDYRGHKILFEYERPPGMENEDRLRVYFDGEPKITLRVEMGIGALEPVEIESFHRGDWLRYYAALIAHIDSNIGQNAGIHRESKAVSMESTRSQAIEELKSRFKID